MAGPSRGSVLSDLRDIATQPTPAPRPDFLAELEARLHEPEGAVATVDTDPPRVARKRIVHTTAVGAVALVAAAVVVALGLTGVGPAQRIRTTPAGEGRGSAGSEGPGTRATTSHSGTGAASDNPSAATTADRHASGSTAPKSGSVAATGSGSSSTLLPSASGIAGDTAATTKTSAGSATFTVRGSGTAARIFLDWDAYKGDDFAAYLVLRSIAPDDPTYPADNQRTLIMLRIEDRATTTYQDTPKVGSTCRYRIVVVDRDANVVAASNVIDPTANPGPPNTTAALPRLAMEPTIGIQSPAVSTS